MKRTLILAAVATALASQAQARDYISVVGSSTVYPFATVVAEQFGNPAAFGVFGYSFLDQNSDRIQGAMVDGVEPIFENIADQSYPVSRPLYLYVKKAHIGTIPGVEEYLAELTSGKAWGTDGYLADKGMIPMPNDERMRFADDVRNLANPSF